MTNPSSDVCFYRIRVRHNSPPCPAVIIARTFRSPKTAKFIQMEPSVNRQGDWIDTFVTLPYASESDISKLKNAQSVIRHIRVVTSDQAEDKTVLIVAIRDIALNALLQTPTVYFKLNKYVASVDYEEFDALFFPCNALSMVTNKLESVEGDVEAHVTEMQRVNPEHIFLKPSNFHPPLSDKVLSDEELFVLNTAFNSGYYELPRRITIDELAKKLGLSKSSLDINLRLISRKVSASYFEQ